MNSLIGLLDESGRVIDVKLANEPFPEGSITAELPFYAGLDWIVKDGNWFQPSGNPPTEDQLTYVISAGAFISRLSDDQALQLFKLATIDGRVSRLVLQLSSLREGIYSTDPLTKQAMALAETLWGKDESARLFAPVTTSEQARDTKVLSKTPTETNAPTEQ